MRLDILLELRDGRERVEVIHPPGSTVPVLGKAQPQEDTRRAALPRRWGWEREAPRKAPLATLDEPLPQRTQTILYYRLPPDVQNALNHGVGDAVNAARNADEGRVSVKLQVDF